jgi:GxxExxY protein
LKHEVTTSTTTHEGECWGASNYRGQALEAGHRLDLLVEDLVIVELKSVERLEPVHELQLLTYLRLSGRWMGLLINFNSVLIKHGLRRMLNG